MECLADIWSSHVLKHSPGGLDGIRRGNDWRMQQTLLHQIKAIEFPGVNTTR